MLLTPGLILQRFVSLWKQPDLGSNEAMWSFLALETKIVNFALKKGISQSGSVVEGDLLVFKDY